DDKHSQESEQKTPIEGATGTSTREPVMTRSRTGKKDKNKKSETEKDEKLEDNYNFPHDTEEQENANAHYERFARRCEERVRKIGDDLNQVVQETIRRLEQVYIKALDAPPSEVDMIDKFSRHFDYETQNAIIAQRLRRVDELIEFLDRLDNVGKLNHEKQPERSPFARREPYYTRAPEVTSPNRFLPRPTYPRREEYHRDFRRDNTRNYQSNRPANVHEIDIHETEEEFPHDDVSAESNQQGSGNE
ncbi:unnamed protein product, partial [Trichogramma brassicae]